MFGCEFSALLLPRCMFTLTNKPFDKDYSNLPDVLTKNNIEHIHSKGVLKLRSQILDIVDKRFHSNFLPI